MTTKVPGEPRTSETCDLRKNLLRTSRELLDEDGPVTFNMREVARRVGCTYQAPYHYFTNRETILAVLVEAGFDELTSRLREAWGKAGTEDLEAVVETSRNAYVEFVLTNPGVSRVVFHRGICDPVRFPGVLTAGKRACDELGRFAWTITGERTAPEREITLWAGVHELAVLPLDDLMADELPILKHRLAYARQAS